MFFPGPVVCTEKPAYLEVRIHPVGAVLVFCSSSDYLIVREDLEGGRHHGSGPPGDSTLPAKSNPFETRVRQEHTAFVATVFLGTNTE